MTEPTLIIAAVEDCLPGRNPRIVTADPIELDSDGLLSAIRTEGVKIPIHVRNHPKKPGMKEIMAGERRHKCCEVAGIRSIRALDYGDLSDDEAFKITLAENGPRKELSPIEQGRAAAYALELCGGDKKAAAALTGQTVRWIAMGARIHGGLIEVWQKELLKGGLLKHWTAGHVALIARFESDVQDDLFNHFVRQNQYRVKDMSVDDVEKETASFLRVLAKAPFDTCDCESCPKQSGRDPGLWANTEAEVIGKKARCTDPRCWAAKERDARQAEFAALAVEHKGLVVVDLLKDDSDWQQTQHLKEIYGEAYVGGPAHCGTKKYEVVPEGTRGAVKALVAAGPKTGQVVTVKYTGHAASAAPKPKTTKAEKECVKREQTVLDATLAVIRRRLVAITLDQLQGSEALTVGLLFSAVYHGGMGIESWGKAREQFLQAWSGVGQNVHARRDSLSKTLSDQVRAHLCQVVFSESRVRRPDAEDLRDFRMTVDAFGWDYDSLVQEAKAMVAREEDLAKRIEIVNVDVPKKLGAACELRILEDGGKWYGGYAVEIPKAGVDLPADTLGESYETKAGAVQAMAEAAAKWLAGQKAEKKCPAVLYKPLATAISEVVGACELQRDRSFKKRLLEGEDGTSLTSVTPLTGDEKRAAVRTGGVIENPETIVVPLETRWKAAVTIKIGEVDGRWYCGYDAHVPGAAKPMPCTVAHRDYGSRDSAVVAASSQILAWLDEQPGKKGYKHHDAIRDAVMHEVLANIDRSQMRCTRSASARRFIEECSPGPRKCRSCGHVASDRCTHCMGTVCPVCRWEESDLCVQCAAAGQGQS